MTARGEIERFDLRIMGAIFRAKAVAVACEPLDVEEDAGCCIFV